MKLFSSSPRPDPAPPWHLAIAFLSYKVKVGMALSGSQTPPSPSCWAPR